MSENKMLTFCPGGIYDPKIKPAIAAQIAEHRRLDQIVKGTYWEDGKGCMVGCILHSSDHTLSESRFGIPAKTFKLAEGIFEALPNKEAVDFPSIFWDAIPERADLSRVWQKFIIWTLSDPEDGVIVLAKENDAKLFVEKVSDLYKADISGDKEKIAECEKAARSAWNALTGRTGWAAWTARDAMSAWTAWTARDACIVRTASSAMSAMSVRSARDAWTARTAWTAGDVYTNKQAKKLIQLLEEADNV